MMMFEAVEAWNLPLLVGALLDLVVVAFLLLCASAPACCSSKFLASFWSRLRCPCYGLFGQPTGTGRCVWEDKSKRPAGKVVGVRVSVAGRFPFGSQKGEGSNGDVNGRSGTRLDVLKCRQPAVRGKGVLNLRRRLSPGRHREGLARCNDTLSCSSSDVRIAKVRAICSPSSLESSCSNQAKSVTSPSCFSLGPDDVLAEEEGSQSNFMKAVDGFGGMEKYEFESVDWDNDVNTCRLVEESVRESEVTTGAECVRCASLRLELEKERNAAATAAEEAMAMIMRLQREKASVEMEAKQYRRVIEEKSAFEAEEMNILKVKREQEKHLLEMKVDKPLENGEQKSAVTSLKGDDDVESMRPVECNSGSNGDIREKVAIYRCDGGPWSSNEPLSACCGLSLLEIEESILPTERLGERNLDGTPADVFSYSTKDAHSDTFDISLNSSSLGDDPRSWRLATTNWGSGSFTTLSF